MTDLKAGATLGDGRYRLQRRLGTGGMASVWLAVDERLDREVAIKVMADTLASDERYRMRFAREARVAASVSDPHIVPVYDYGIQAGRPYLVLEYIPDGSLAARLSEPADDLDAAAVAEGLLQALAHIHEVGLVHRDVKPANILIDRQGRVRLTDFGIAQPQDATSLTQTGVIVGTLRYLAPEVIEGAAATPASDLYAVGVVLREMAQQTPAASVEPLITALTARQPEGRPRSAAAARRLLAGPRPSPRTAPTATRRDTAPTARLNAATRGAPPLRRGKPTAHTASTRVAKRGLPQQTQWALVAMATVALVIVLIAVASSGGPKAHSANRLSPAAPTAPLKAQLRALDAIVSGDVRH